MALSDMSITEVEEEANSLDQSVFAAHDVIELMKQATGFNCDKVTESEALFILNSISTFHYLEPQPQPKGVRFSDQHAFTCLFCTLTGCSSTFAKKSGLRQHNRDHFGILFTCAHCHHAERERAGVLKHIWSEHPGEIEEIDSTDIETLIDARHDAMFDDDDEEEEDEDEDSPQAAKGVRINLFSCLEQSLLEQTTTNRLDFSTLDHSIIEHSILEDTVNEANVSFEDSLIKSIGIDLNSTKNITTIEHEIRKDNKPLIKRIHLNKGNVLRVSDQGLTPDRKLLHKDCRLFKRIYMNEGKVARISDHGLFSPLAKDK